MPGPHQWAENYISMVEMKTLTTSMAVLLLFALINRVYVRLVMTCECWSIEQIYMNVLGWAHSITPAVDSSCLVVWTEVLH